MALSEGPNQFFTCRTCGERHLGLGPPLSWSADAPYHWYDVPEGERGARVQLSSDQCIVDDKFYFGRGCLDIPVLGSSDVFT